MKSTTVYKYLVSILLIGISIQLFSVAAYATTPSLNSDVKSVIAGDPASSFVVTYNHGTTIDNSTIKFDFAGLAINTSDQYSLDGGSTKINCGSGQSQISSGSLTITGYSGTGNLILYLNNKTYTTGGFCETLDITYGSLNSSSYKSLWAVKGYSAPTNPSNQSFTVSPSALAGGSSGNNIKLTFLNGYNAEYLPTGTNGALLKFNLPAGITASGTDTVEFFNWNRDATNTSLSEQTLTAAGAVISGNSVILKFPTNDLLSWFTPVILRLNNKTAPTTGPLAFSVQVDQDGTKAVGLDLYEYSRLDSYNSYSMPLATATSPGSSMILYSNYWSKAVATVFVEGTTLADFAVSYTPGEALPDGTVVFTIPDALKGSRYTGYFGPSSGNNGHEVYDGSITTWGLNSEYSATLVQSGNTFTMKGVKTNAGEVVVLQAWDSMPAPAAGTYNFSVTADADGDGTMATRKPGYSGVTDGSTRIPSTATTKSITSSTKSIYQLSYNGDTSGEYFVAKSAGSITLTVIRTGNTDSTTTVGYQTADGYQYHNGTDWAISNPGWDFTPTYNIPHTLTFNPGETSKTFTVTINPNWATGEVHQNKYFIAWLSSPSNNGILGENSGYVGQTLHPAYIIIAASPLPVLTSAETTTAGDKLTLSFDKAMWDPTETHILFGVKVNGVADNVTTASANTDPTKIDLTLATPVTFGQTVTVSYTRTNYFVRSAWEVGLEPLLSFTDQAVTNNLPSPTPVVGLSAATYSVKESDGNLAVTVNRTGGTQAFTVNYATSDSSAIAGKNYVAGTGTLSFAAGETSKTINIKINNDGLKVKDNTFNLTLSNPDGASLATASSAVVTITDTTAGLDPVVPTDLPIEPSGSFQFSTATYSGYEGKNLGVTITRTGGSNGVVGVSWSFDESSTAVSDTDFSPDTTNTSPLSFADGETSKTLTFAIPSDTDNSVVRAGKTIVLSLSTPTGNATIGTQTSTTITLIDFIPDTTTSKNTAKTLIALNSPIALNPGDSTEGLLSVTLSNGAIFNLDSGDGGITWKSASTKIATVNSGVITAVGFGSTKVTAAYGGKTAIFTVNTALQALSGVDSYGTTIPEAKAGATTPTLNLNLNSTDTILLSATNVNSVQAYVYSGMAWTTSNKMVVTIENNGVISTTGKPGTATITGTYGGKKVTAKINTALTDLTLSYPISTTPLVIFTPSSSSKIPAKLDMKLGDISAPLVLTTTLATSALADVAADSTTKWTTSNIKVASVEKGVVTTTTLPGVATITGTYGGKSVKVTVNTNLSSLAVTYPDPTTPTVIFTAGATAAKPYELKMKPGDVSKALVVTNTFANDESVDVAGDAVWKSSSEKIATVEKGVITTSATNLGKATITVTSGKKATINVNTAITGLAADKAELKLKPSGATGTIVLTASFANGATGDVAASAEWKSSKATVATVTNGVVTSVSPGTTDISAKYGGKTVKIKVITSLTLATDSSASVTVGGQKAVALTATYADGTTEDVTTKAIWTSTKETVASVSSGQITGVKVGTASIKATYLGVTKIIPVTVSA